MSIPLLTLRACRQRRRSSNSLLGGLLATHPKSQKLSTKVRSCGEYLEMDVSPDLGTDYTITIEARTDARSNKCSKVFQIWPQPLHGTPWLIYRVRIANNTTEPKTARRPQQLCQARHTIAVDPTHYLPPNVETPHPSLFFSLMPVRTDPNNISPENIRNQLSNMLLANDNFLLLLDTRTLSAPSTSTQRSCPSIFPRQARRTTRYV